LSDATRHEILAVPSRQVAQSRVPCREVIMAVHAGVSAHQLAKDIESTGFRVRSIRPALDSNAPRIELILTNGVSIVWDRSSRWAGAVGWFPEMARMEAMLLELYGESKLRQMLTQVGWCFAVLTILTFTVSVFAQILR
jgi:hypothetical protein